MVYIPIFKYANSIARYNVFANKTGSNRVIG